MVIRSGFMRSIISRIISKALKKQMPGLEVQVNEIQASWSEKDQKIKVHLALDAEMTKAQLNDILQKADLL